MNSKGKFKLFAHPFHQNTYCDKYLQVSAEALLTKMIFQLYFTRIDMRMCSSDTIHASIPSKMAINDGILVAEFRFGKIVKFFEKFVRNNQTLHITGLDNERDIFVLISLS